MISVSVRHPGNSTDDLHTVLVSDLLAGGKTSKVITSQLLELALFNLQGISRVFRLAVLKMAYYEEVTIRPRGKSQLTIATGQLGPLNTLHPQNLAYPDPFGIGNSIQSFFGVQTFRGNCVPPSSQAHIFLSLGNTARKNRKLSGNRTQS